VIKVKVTFLEGRLLSNQSKQFKKYEKRKAGPPKKPLLCWSCKRANCVFFSCTSNCNDF